MLFVFQENFSKFNWANDLIANLQTIYVNHLEGTQEIVFLPLILQPSTSNLPRFRGKKINKRKFQTIEDRCHAFNLKMHRKILVCEIALGAA